MYSVSAWGGLLRRTELKKILAALALTAMVIGCSDRPEMRAGPGKTAEDLRLDGAYCAQIAAKTPSAGSMAGSAAVSTALSFIPFAGPVASIAAGAAQAAAGTPFIGATVQVDEPTYTNCMTKRGHVMNADAKD